MGLSSAREEAGRREREWGEERERREVAEQGLNQQVGQLQNTLLSLKKEKVEASSHTLQVVSLLDMFCIHTYWIFFGRGCTAIIQQ